MPQNRTQHLHLRPIALQCDSRAPSLNQRGNEIWWKNKTKHISLPWLGLIWIFFPIKLKVYSFTTSLWSCKTLCYKKPLTTPPQVLFCRSHSHYLVLWSVWLNYRKWLIHHSAWSEWSAPARCLCFCPTNLIHQQKQAQGCTGLLPAQDCAALSLAFTQASATCHRNPGSFVQGAVWAPPSFPSHLVIFESKYTAPHVNDQS